MVFPDRKRMPLLAALLGVMLAIGALLVHGPVPARAEGPAAACSWAGESDQRDVNIGAPDLDAYYWLSPIPVTSGTKVVISGQYPRARYFSLTTYNLATLPTGSLYDQQIAPDPGSVNPFQGPARAGAAESYHVQLVFSDAPAHPAANTLYAGAPGTSNPVALLELRVYVPDDTAEPQGGVPFPQITTETTAGTPLVTQGACSVTPPSFDASFWEQYAQANSSPGASTPADGATATPTWTRAFGSSFGNPQNAYLTTIVSHHFGSVVVIHTRAPSFPDTSAGQPAYGPQQLRYWSICTYDSSGEAVIGCAADYHAAITDGWITYVISDPADRPANATAANGVTWLPWSSADAIEVVYRNMLPSPSFPYAAERITSASQSAQALMGPYYPTAGYCSTATFERSGWRACVPAPAAAVKSTGKHKAKQRRRRHTAKRHRRKHQRQHRRARSRRTHRASRR
jgi:hypothetical protein